MSEPEIIINGINVGPGCALTLRVAIETFVSSLIEEGLGDDEHSKSMKKHYLDRCNDIRRAMGLYNE